MNDVDCSTQVADHFADAPDPVATACLHPPRTLASPVAHEPVWRRAAHKAGLFDASATLIFLDRTGLGATLADTLRKRGQHVITVRAGRRYRASKDGNYDIDPRAAQDYERLVAALAERDRRPGLVYHLWTVTGVQRHTIAALQDMGMSSLLLLARALGARGVGPIPPLAMVVVSDGVQRVSDEGGLDPAKATVLGPCRTIPHHGSGIDLRHVDIRLPRRNSLPWTGLCDMLIAEPTGRDRDDMVAYRGSERWVRTWAPLSAIAANDAPCVGDRARGDLKTSGVYLITGGLTGFSLALTGHLAQLCDARLAVILPAPLPPRAHWADIAAHGGADPLAIMIRQICVIEVIGGAVMPIVADVTEARDMARAVRQIRACWGPLDGVFHAADLPGHRLAMQPPSSSPRQPVSAAFQGTLALDAALRDERPDFLLLLSSPAAVAGLASGDEASGAEDASASAFLAAYAQSRRGDTTCVTLIDWSGWHRREVASSRAALRAPVVPGPQVPMDHAILRSLYRLPAGDMVAEGMVSPRHPWLRDEQELADGATLMSVTGLVELVRAGFLSVQPGPCVLRDVLLLAPFTPSEGDCRTLRVHFARGDDGDWRDDAGWHFSVLGQTLGQRDWIEHACGTIFPLGATVTPPFDPAAVMARCVRSDAFDACSPMHGGLHWPTLRQSWVGQGEAMLDLELDRAGTEDLLPGVLDCTIAAARCLLADRSGGEVVIAGSVGAISLYAPLPRQVIGHIRTRDLADNRADGAMIDITLTDTQGLLIARIDNLTMVRVDRECWRAAVDRHGSRPRVKPAACAVEGLRIIHQVLERAHSAHWMVSSTGTIQDDGDAPATATERLIGDIWSDLSPPGPIGRQTDLIASGAHPLIALHALSQLGERTGKHLSLATMLKATTVAELAILIDAKQGSAPVRARGGTTPLFMIHDGSGQTAIYHALAARMDDGRPVLGIEPDRYAGGPYMHTGVTDMARAYVARVRKVQPQGPYLLSGLDAGGVIAFDMACQLQAMGEQVALVAIIDSADVEAHERPFRFFRLGIPRLRKGSLPFLRLWARARQTHHPRGLFTGGETGGEVILFKATQGTGTAEDQPASTRYTDCLLGWGKRVAGEVTLVAVPGGHRSALQEPHVEALARRLCDAIARVLPQDTSLPAEAPAPARVQVEQAVS